MSNTPPQKPSHTTPADPFGPLIATSFRSNGTMRQYYDYTPAADMSTRGDAFRIGATHATKRRNAQSEGIVEEQHDPSEEGIATVSARSRSWDSLAEGAMSEDVEGSGDSGDGQGSDASSRTLGRSESSGSTVAGGEDDNGKENSEGEGDSDESMEDGGDEEESEASSHTVGRSEDSDSGDDGGDEDSDEEMGESDDEGDLFGGSYRKGSGK